MLDLIEFGIFLVLLIVGFFAGTIVEKRHYASIRKRERQYADVLAFAVRFPPDRVTPQRAFLVHGTVVISSDYFKTFVAGLRNLFGGRVRTYETLMERARREALLRLKHDARRPGREAGDLRALRNDDDIDGLGGVDRGVRVRYCADSGAGQCNCVRSPIRRTGLARAREIREPRARRGHQFLG